MKNTTTHETAQIEVGDFVTITTGFGTRVASRVVTVSEVNKRQIKADGQVFNKLTGKEWGKGDDAAQLRLPTPREAQIQQSILDAEAADLKDDEAFANSVRMSGAFDEVEQTTTGTCWCGCGAATKKGSRFLQGHDAKLKGILIRRNDDEMARVPAIVLDNLGNLFRGRFAK